MKNNILETIFKLQKTTIFASCYPKLIKGRRTAQKEIGGGKTQVTYSSNGTIKGNIEVTDTEDFVSVSKGNFSSRTRSSDG